MEEMFLRMCVVLVSLLCLDDYTVIEKLDDDTVIEKLDDDTVIEKLDDDITMGMQERKHFLQEGAKLEQRVPSVAIELPHSVQEVSQSHHTLTKESDVQEILPNGKEQTQEHQMPPKEDQDILYQKLMVENNLDNSQTEKTAPLSDDNVSEQAQNINHTASLLDQNLSSMEMAMSETEHAGQEETMHILTKENKIVSPEKQVTLDKKEFPHIVQDVNTLNENQIQEIPPLSNKTHSDQKDTNLGQKQTAVKQKTSKEGKPFFQKIYEFLYQWSQTSPDMHPSEYELLKDSKGSQMQMNGRTVKVIQKEAPLNGRKSGVYRGGPLDSQETPQTGQVQTKSMQHPGSENAYTWYLWKALSLISLIRILWKFFGRGLKTSGTIFPTIDNKKFPKLFLPDHDVLSCFYEQHVQIPPNIGRRACEFVEGFVNELLEVMRRTSDKETGMQIEDFVGVGSLYELWATGKRMVCDLYVPFTAPRSYGFNFEFWKDKNVASLVAGCGKIKVMKNENTFTGCPCSSGNLDDDTLCLLHPHFEMKSTTVDAIGGPLCRENTPYLSKAQVVRWFRTAVSKAWGEISHKYEFELTFRNQAAPGALKVRFRSGKVILFNIVPVVQVKGSKVNLLSYLSSNQSSLSDIDWPISFAGCENALLQKLEKTLPYNSCHIRCLQILSFLHKQQISLTGKCGLTSYHLKTTLLYLLLVKKPIAWKCDQLAERLIDMLTFLEQGLHARKLNHALIGNPLVPNGIGLPEEFQLAKPTNLLLPLASNTESYVKTIQHLQELVRNAPVLIHEYTSMTSSTEEQKAKASF